MPNRGEPVQGDKGHPKQAMADRAVLPTSVVEAQNGGALSIADMIELVGTAVFLTDGETLLYANAEAERITGFSREELATFDLFATIHPDDRERVKGFSVDLLNGREVPVRDEVRIVARDGTVRWTSLAGRPVKLDGRIAILGTAIDVSERKVALEALHESEMLYRSLVETSPDAIALADLEGRLVMVNQRAADLLGFDEIKDLVGRDAFEWIAPEERPRARENAVLTLERGRCHEAEYSVVRRDGSRFFVALTASRIDDGDGRPQAFLASIRDLTDRKRIEEIERRAERLESLGLLAGGIAHDFNNVLTAILGNLGMARRALTRDSQLAGRKLDSAEGAVLNAKRLTQQLLTFSKGGEPVTEALYLGPVLRETAALTLGDANVLVELALPARLHPVDAAPGQLRQLFGNLLLNAAQSMPEGGTITIAAVERHLEEREVPPLSPGDYIELTVTDEGRGIPAEHLAIVFDPYFTTKPGGTGLGLSTCYSIMRRHRGAIFVESEENVGTTFKIFFPRSKRSPATNDEPDQKRGRILVMDSDTTVRDVAVNMLLEAGYDACAAQDGREAIQRYRTASTAGRPFDVVILDLSIADGAKGKETLRKLRTIDANVRAIVSSAALNDPLTSEFALFGFQGAVAKPYTFSELCNTVQKVLER